MGPKKGTELKSRHGGLFVVAVIKIVIQLRDVGYKSQILYVERVNNIIGSIK